MKQIIRIFKFIGVFFILLNLISCAEGSHLNLNQRLAESDSLSRSKFTPELARAGFSQTPHQLAFLVFKNTRTLEIYARNDRQWKYLDSYQILAESGHSGPKLRQGDHQVPEGIYHIAALNPSSHYDMSMELNYPNEDDLRFAALDHRNHLGDEIFIHGHRSSVGCIAIGDRAIEQLYPLVAQVGPENVEVVVAPNDLRTQAPRYSFAEPRWVPYLYSKIGRTLRQFPVA